MDTIRMPQWGRPLEEKDYLHLEARWITKELADQALLRRVTSEDGAQITDQRPGRDYAGILIPYYIPGAPDVINYRLRRDKPELLFNEKGEAKPDGKYLGAPNSRNRLYMVPGTPVEPLTDVALPIVFTEGEFKTLALFRLAGYNSASPRFLPIGLSGVWNWRGGVGKAAGPDGERVDIKGPIPDLDRLRWDRRIVNILFDVNVRSNQSVSAARTELSKELQGRGAQVLWVELPAASGSVNGVDDFLAVNGPESALQLIAAAKPARVTDECATQAQHLVRLAEGVALFHTPDNEGYAGVPVNSLTVLTKSCVS